VAGLGPRIRNPEKEGETKEILIALTTLKVVHTRGGAELQSRVLVGHLAVHQSFRPGGNRGVGRKLVSDSAAWNPSFNVRRACCLQGGWGEGDQFWR